MMLLHRTKKLVSLTVLTATATTTKAAFRSASNLCTHPSFSLPSLTPKRFPLCQESLLPFNHFTTARHMSSQTPAYWNREDSTPLAFSADGPVVQEARIVVLASSEDPNNAPLYQPENLPEGAKVVAIGQTVEQLDVSKLQSEKPNVLFVSDPKAREPLAKLLPLLPDLVWIHTRSAGIDFVTSPTLSEFVSPSDKPATIQMTNAKGCFSSTLAEYTMMACSYFAKDLPRLLRQKSESNWQQYPILELRGATLGIVGYGDIGRAAAKLAKAYGMKIVALRRDPSKGKDDPLVDDVLGPDQLTGLFGISDYVLCAAPLTPDTHKMIGKEQFAKAKPGCVFMNVGRGPIVDEEALIDALQDTQGPLKGAGLDVTTIEPLPKESPIWNLPNVLLSPHNMDMTETFMKESTEFFIQENLPRFLRGETLLNPVDPAQGY